jgi:hypothetical protein
MDTWSNMKLNISINLGDEYGYENDSIETVIKDLIRTEIETAVRKYLKQDAKLKSSIVKYSKQIVEEFDANPSIFTADIKNKVLSSTMKKMVFENKQVQNEITRVMINRIKQSI